MNLSKFFQSLQPKANSIPEYDSKMNISFFGLKFADPSTFITTTSKYFAVPFQEFEVNDADQVLTTQFSYNKILFTFHSVKPTVFYTTDTYTQLISMSSIAMYVFGSIKDYFPEMESDFLIFSEILQSKNPSIKSAIALNCVNDDESFPDALKEQIIEKYKASPTLHTHFLTNQTKTSKASIENFLDDLCRLFQSCT